MNKEIKKSLEKVEAIAKKHEGGLLECEARKETLINQLAEYSNLKDPDTLKIREVIKLKIELIDGEIAIINLNINKEIKALNFDELVLQFERSYKKTSAKHEAIQENYCKEIKAYCTDKMNKFYDETLPERQEQVDTLDEIRKTINRNSTLKVEYGMHHIPVTLLGAELANEMRTIENEIFHPNKK